MFKSRLMKMLKNPLVRYFIMAGFVVVIELAVFAFINITLQISYLIATPVSLIVAVLLNWYLSRVIVFNGSKHKLSTEFTLIMATSAVGIVLQLAVTASCVQLLHLEPIIGKLFAIFASFFWNFWVRKRYIFEINAF